VLDLGISSNNKMHSYSLRPITASTAVCAACPAAPVPAAAAPPACPLQRPASASAGTVRLQLRRQYSLSPSHHYLRRCLRRLSRSTCFCCPCYPFYAHTPASPVRFCGREHKHLRLQLLRQCSRPHYPHSRRLPPAPHGTCSCCPCCTAASNCLVTCLQGLHRGKWGQEAREVCPCAPAALACRREHYAGAVSGK
jgi:hypothetical protein